MAALPSMRHAARDLLVASPTFVAVLATGRLVFKAPPDVTTPFGILQVPGNNSLSGDNVAWSLLVQLDGYCSMDDPEADDIAWNIAAAGAEILGRARNVAYLGVTYSARLVDGPMALPPEVSRGQATPLARAVTRAELTAHLR
jgi:hypothetical protein